MGGEAEHIPDGFLDVVTVIVTYVMLFGYGGYALRRIKGALGTESASLLSVLAAGIFAAQMLNWPVPGGTSLHFVGGFSRDHVRSMVWLPNDAPSLARAMFGFSRRRNNGARG